MSSNPEPVILGLVLPLIVAPPNSQNQLTLIGGEGDLNCQRFEAL